MSDSPVSLNLFWLIHKCPANICLLNNLFLMLSTFIIFKSIESIQTTPFQENSDQRNANYIIPAKFSISILFIALKYLETFNFPISPLISRCFVEHLIEEYLRYFEEYLISGYHSFLYLITVFLYFKVPPI